MRTQFSDFQAKNVFSVSWWHQPQACKIRDNNNVKEFDAANGISVENKEIWC
jgi:hypothetical protein